MSLFRLRRHRYLLAALFIFICVLQFPCSAVNWGTWQDVQVVNSDSMMHVVAGSLIGTLVRFSEPDEPKHVQFWHAFWLSIGIGLVKEAFDIAYYRSNSNKIVLTDSFKDIIMNTIGVLISFNMDFKGISGSDASRTSLLDDPDPLGQTGRIKYDLRFSEKISLPSVSSSF